MFTSINLFRHWLKCVRITQIKETHNILKGSLTLTTVSTICWKGCTESCPDILQFPENPGVPGGFAPWPPTGVLPLDPVTKLPAIRTLLPPITKLNKNPAIGLSTIYAPLCINKIMACNIQQNPRIHGLQPQDLDAEVNLSQFADGMTFSLTDEQSIIETFNTSDLYEQALGDKINKGK